MLIVGTLPDPVPIDAGNTTAVLIGAIVTALGAVGGVIKIWTALRAQNQKYELEMAALRKSEAEARSEMSDDIQRVGATMTQAAQAAWVRIGEQDKRITELESTNRALLLELIQEKQANLELANKLEEALERIAILERSQPHGS